MIRQDTFAETGYRIAEIARSAEAVSLGLLDAIDDTVLAMDGIAKIMSGFYDVLAGAADEIAQTEIVEGEYLDADDAAIDAMERLASRLKDFLTKLVVKRSAIDKDARLKDHHCEALHDAYEAAMSATADLIEEIQAVRSALIAHDLKAEPRGNAKAYETVDTLIASLRSE
jgi:hypothetical protein